MLFAPTMCELHKVASSLAAGVRPTASMGSTVTPTQNDIASAGWTTLISSASVTSDVYEIEVNINSIGVSAAARCGLAELGYDPGGGTSFVHLAYLLPGPAATYVGNTGPGCRFRVACLIPAASSIGMRGSVDSATLTAFRAFVDAYGRPSPSHLYRAMHRVQDIGFDLGNSAGTAVTSGTTSEGAWTTLGTLDFDTEAFEFGLGFDDSATNANSIDVEVGVGDAAAASVRTVIDHTVVVSNIENCWRSIGFARARAKAGETVFARCQTGPNAAPTGITVAVNAMGA